MPLPVVAVLPQVSEALRLGHPWVYRNQIAPLGGHADPARLASGTWVRVRCGAFHGIGLWDAQGAIALRLFGAQMPDAAWVLARVCEAWECRSPLRASGAGRETTAYRWVYGESDGLPGVVVDLYGAYAAVHLYAESVRVLLEPLLKALVTVAPLRGIMLRQSGSGVAASAAADSSADDPAPGKAVSVWGEAPPRDLVVAENGLKLYANLAEGQKTGLFLDQRDNRAYLEPWCRGRRVLDLFAYVGAFGLYAARGGAAKVTSVDIAPRSATEVARNLRLNGVDPATYEPVVADCFDWLAACAARGERFDLVIVDPPSLAKSKANRYAAVRAYTRLNRLALACLAPGGLLASASCTSQVSPEILREALASAAAQAGVRLAILHEAGHALDHPVAAHLPEARYLKFILAQARSY